jgi:hypothetical protein
MDATTPTFFLAATTFALQTTAEPMKVEVMQAMMLERAVWRCRVTCAVGMTSAAAGRCTLEE